MSKPIPYDASAELETQIQASFANSLKNLRTSYVDSYLLHSPLDTLPRTLAAWKVLVALQDAGVVRRIGVSNTYDLGTLEALEREGGRRPDVVQNRWHEGNQWDNDVWAYCVKHGIQYQYVRSLLNLYAHRDIRVLLGRSGRFRALRIFCATLPSRALAQRRDVRPRRRSSRLPR